MICISIAEITFEDIQKSLRRCERLLKEDPELVAEIRMDLYDMTSSQVRKLFIESKIPLIAVCRRSTMNVIEDALEAGAKYVDIDAMSSESFFRKMAPSLLKWRAKKIFSYRNYTDTPTMDELVKIYKMSVERGADIVKIATTANSVDDAERVLNLYRLMREGKLSERSVPLIAFAMGDKGTYTRLEALNLGAPMTYCSLKDEKKFHSGQLSYKKMVELYRSDKVAAEVKMPTSKSIAQRAIIAAALAQGESIFHNFSHCRDIDNALGVARQVGARVVLGQDYLSVTGIGFSAMKRKAKPSANSMISAIVPTDALSLFVGESGLLSRLCIPIAAQMGDGVTISGEGSLMGRQMQGCRDALEQLGAKCILAAEDTLPVMVSGPLKGGNATVSGVSGSQLISGLLMALPLSRKDSTLTIVNPTSLPYIQLTTDTLRLFGIQIEERFDENRLIFTIPGKQKYNTAELTLEDDWSSAANFIALGALFGNLLIKGIKMDSHQADKAIVDILKGCGANITVEKRGLRVKRSHLSAFEYDATHSPDLFPVLSILAALTEGQSTIKGINRLRNKESNRTIAIQTNLTKMGVFVELEDDYMIINGISPARRRVENKLLKGGNYSSYNDHRIAMMLRIASLCSDDRISIDQTECINKSFPTFNELFNSTIISSDKK